MQGISWFKGSNYYQVRGWLMNHGFLKTSNSGYYDANKTKGFLEFDNGAETIIIKCTLTTNSLGHLLCDKVYDYETLIYDNKNIKMDKLKLYETIMASVAKLVKKAIYEDGNLENKPTEFLDVIDSPVKSDFKADESSPYTWGSHEFEGSKHYVFLGGTCAKSTWRKPICDLLAKNKISYFQPQSNDWQDFMMTAEDKAKAKADMQLFVLTSEMTGFYSLVEILEMIMKCNEGKMNPKNLRIGIMGDLSTVQGDKQLQKGIKKTVADIFSDKIAKPLGLVIKLIASDNDLIKLIYNK